MPEFGVGQNDARQERAKRWGQADHIHEHGDADHDEQGDGCINLAQVRAVDIAEHRAGEENPRQHHKRDSADGDEGDAPGREALNQRNPMMGRVLGMRICPGNGPVRVERHLRRGGQERHERQHRDHGDILGQEHGEGGGAAARAHQVLFRQGLQHDSGRGERKDHPKRDPRLPAEPGPDRCQGDERAGQQDLQPAKPQQFVPHVPKRARIKLEPD